VQKGMGWYNQASVILILVFLSRLTSDRRSERALPSYSPSHLHLVNVCVIADSSIVLNVLHRRSSGTHVHIPSTFCSSSSLPSLLPLRPLVHDDRLHPLHSCMIHTRAPLCMSCRCGSCSTKSACRHTQTLRSSYKQDYGAKAKALLV
jgi:hypothetical protein